MEVLSQPLNYVKFTGQDYLHTDADEAACMKGKEALMYSRMAYANYHTMTLGIPCGARADLKCQLKETLLHVLPFPLCKRLQVLCLLLRLT